jgi:hypothetical protein
MILGTHFTTGIDLGAGHVGMDLDATRHNDHATGVNDLTGGLHLRYDLAVRHTDVTYLAVDPVQGIIDFTVHNLEHVFPP